jgi:hypothetical protein
MLNSSRTVRIAQNHESLVDDEFHEWVVINERVHANAAGIANARIAVAEWTKFVCNNTACAGWGLAHLDKLLQTTIDSDF